MFLSVLPTNFRASKKKFKKSGERKKQQHLIEFRSTHFFKVIVITSVAYRSLYILARWCLHSCLASKPQQNNLGPVDRPSRCNDQGMFLAINFEVFQRENRSDVNH